MPLIATKGAASAQGFGEFAQTTAPVYIEDVFSTWLYTGTGATQTITNGIDLAGKGGLVWIKDRSAAIDHIVFDTVRGATKGINTNLTNAQGTYTNALTAFTSSGFSLGSPSTYVNTNGDTYASWTFRKQPKFFDVVTYTGNGTTNNVSHALGSTPGFIIIKKTSGTGDWIALCRKNDTQGIGLYLNSTASNYYDGNWPFNIPVADATTLRVSWINDQIVGGCNDSGSTYVAYLFAHNAGGFGLTGSDNVISCGSFTVDGSGNCSVSLGYEPQWLMVKSSTAVDNWYLFDNMRGFPVSPANGELLRPNTSGAGITASTFRPTATGFTGDPGTGFGTGIYIAIRRGPMKTPTTGTSVFNAITRTGTGAAATITGIGFAPDFVYPMCRNDIANKGGWVDKLRGASANLTTNLTDAESTNTQGVTAFGNTSISVGTSSFFNGAFNYVNYFFVRAPGFFDVVCYTGTGSATTVSHNLGVAPELVILKRRNGVEDWPVLQANIPTQATLNGTFSGDPPNSSYFGNGTSYVAPTSTVFSVGTNSAVNASGGTYVAYLFASVSGVSKVGSYTGTGTTLQVNCGFTGGSRFVLIKRTDSTGDWYVWDSARGIVAGNDPYLLLNSTAAEVTNTDYVDTYSAGFEISSTAPAAINANGGTYIFLAIA